ncbi:myb/SANT-like DNA-binding domain-containing protein 3 [Anneissia japonica]|uniref:myb/SANT-like DNA-binding domain-containing protein 3 n=1 Tax=Anneissia japonica TaxID=1529436 RepID=UPI0014255A72|nr:myb/SANT-like DNA-binding domain-containing protein 3 [Anneissia japonica]
MAIIKKVTDFEKEFLLELVNKYMDIVESKDFKMIEQKSVIWEKIAREFNEEHICSKKSSAQLRKCWANMKARAKKSCLRSLSRSADGQPLESLRREHAKIIQMLPQHFADITESVENEEILSQMIAANNTHTANKVVPDAIQAVSPNRDQLLAAMKTEWEEDNEDEMSSESIVGTSNSLTSDPPVVSTVGATHHLPSENDDHLNKDCQQMRSELDNRTQEMEIRLLEDKIRFQTEEHKKKMDILHHQFTHAEQEHEMKMLYLKLKLDKLTNLKK